LYAAEVLWAEGPKALRDTLHAEAMGVITNDYADDEADAFHALAILGLSQGVREIASYMRAGKIALDLFTRSPRHPGAAHYVIHAFDDPDHAILALDAARAYSRIAPDAGHAQHMTTHIFLALGMWDLVARQNVVAMQASTGDSDSLAWRPGHYTWWLNYARLQQGKRRDGTAWLRRQGEMLPADAVPMRRNFLQRMRDEWQVNVGFFDQVPSGLITPAQRTATGILTRGLAAAQHATQRPEPLEGAARELSALRTAQPDDTDVRLLEPQLRALVLLHRGQPDSAVAALRPAVELEASLPMDFGPPGILRPAHEAMAELLLSTGRYAEAKAAYDRALARTPGRSRTLAGLAIAARRAGDEAASSRAVAALEANFHEADPGALAALMASLPVPTMGGR
jgi:tetratricopeptide (TPR) repeat protein